MIPYLIRQFAQTLSGMVNKERIREYTGVAPFPLTSMFLPALFYQLNKQ
jgi:hypothetical protein